MHSPLDQTLDRIAAVAEKIERVWNLARWMVAAISAGVLWVARVEWSHADHEKRLSGVEGDTKVLNADVARMKGSLSLSLNEPPPSPQLVWRPRGDAAETAHEPATPQEGKP